MAKSQTRAGAWARRCWAAGALAAALLTVAACGNVTAGKTAGGRSAASPAPSRAPSTRSPLQGSVPLGAGPALCAGIPQLRTLTITRVVTLRNRLHFPFPATVQLTGPPAVQAVATAACQLPQLPRVMMTCPADLGISYRLAFSAPGRSYPALTASATGCAKLTGLDGTREAVPSFWATLGRAMHLATPGAATFGGHPD